MIGCGIVNPQQPRVRRNHHLPYPPLASIVSAAETETIPSPFAFSHRLS